MLTVTNGISPHFLPFQFRPDVRNNQHPANISNAHALTVPVIPPPQRIFGATFSNFTHPSINPPSGPSNNLTTTATFGPIRTPTKHEFPTQFMPSESVVTEFSTPAIQCRGESISHYSTRGDNNNMMKYTVDIPIMSPLDQAHTLLNGCTSSKENRPRHLAPRSTAPVLLASSGRPSFNNFAPLLQNNSTPLASSLSPDASTSSSPFTPTVPFPCFPSLPKQLNANVGATQEIVRSKSDDNNQEISSIVKTDEPPSSPSNNEDNSDINSIWSSRGVQEDQFMNTDSDVNVVENRVCKFKINKVPHGINAVDNKPTTCPVSVDDLKVGSLRHSIESILNMETSSRNHHNAELVEGESIERKDKHDEEDMLTDESKDVEKISFQEDDNDENVDNDELNENISIGSRNEEENEEEEDIDSEYNDAISISSSIGINEYVANIDTDSEKEDQDVDITSQDENSRPSGVSSPDINFTVCHDEQESIFENSSLKSTDQEVQGTNGDVLEVVRDVASEVSLQGGPEKDEIRRDNYSKLKPEFGHSQHQGDKFEKSREHNINEHLKRIEGLIAKQKADHFQKDEFYQAKMHILRSVTKSCKRLTNCHPVANQQTCQSRTFAANGVGLNACNIVPSLPTLPPFHSLFPAEPVVPNIHQCPPLCPCHRSNPQPHPQTQYCHPFHAPEHNTVLQSADQSQEERSRNMIDFLQGESQKSAFKPIVKRPLQPHLTPPMRSPNQTKIPTVPGETAQELSLLHCSRGFPERGLNPSNEGTTFGDSPSAVAKTPAQPSLEESINLDAISLLRLRSNSYQSPDSMPASFSYSSSSRPNPDAVRAWIAWLRARNPDFVANSNAIQQLPSVLSKAPPPPRYHCSDCNKTYSTFGGLSKHRQFHCALHVKKEFACKICTKSYSSLGALKMHIRTHTLPCKCHICGKAFSRPWLLQGHVRTHTGEKPFRCSHCGRAFADRSNLRAHLQTHAEIKKYACVKCGKTFSRMSLLTKHSDGSCPANNSQCI